VGGIEQDRILFAVQLPVCVNGVLVKQILVEVLKRDRYRCLRSGGRRDSGVDVSDLRVLGNTPHGCRDANGHARHTAFWF
jgi:hypothetical protein